MRTWRWLAALALVAGAAVFLTVGSASAAGGPNCGDTVNGNVSLGHDLICPFTDGLIVGSPNTTIHLNGHKIVCSNDALGCYQDGDSGVVTVYNNTQVIGPGTVSGFWSNISILGSGANTIKNLSTDWGASHASLYGVFIDEGASNFVQHVTDTGSQWSIASYGGFSNGFDNNTSMLAGTGDYELPAWGGGILLYVDSQDIVHGNVVTHAEGDTEEPDGGITLYYSDHTQVWQNKVDHTIYADSSSDTGFDGGPGFSDICSTYSTYTGNTASSNYYDGFGIYHGDCYDQRAPVKASFPFDHAAGLQVTMTGNLSKQNGYDGIYLDKADQSEDPSVCPVFGYPCGGSTLTGNTLVGNGGFFGGSGLESYRTYSSHFFHNTTNSNVGSGMLWELPAADGINGNTSKQNGEDGLTIFVDFDGSPFTCEVTGPFGGCDPQFVNYNTLVHNGEFGGFSDELVASIGNVANNNGTAPIDCVNISCVAHAAAAATPALAAKAAKLHAERTFARPFLTKPPAVPAHP